MPAANSMVKYVASLNSGFSCGLPSFNLEYLDKYSTIMNKAHTSWVPIYSQVNVLVIHPLHSAISAFAALAFKIHHTTKPQIIRAERRDTTGLSRMLNAKLLQHGILKRSQRHFFDVFSWAFILWLFCQDWTKSEMHSLIYIWYWSSVTISAKCCTYHH